MNDLDRLQSAMKNYRSLVYSEEEFKDVLNSIIGTITESHQYNLRARLTEFEGELERILYMFDKKMIREKFLEEIQKIQILLQE